MIMIKTIILGPLQTNCYVVYDDTTLDAIIFDPSEDKNGKLHTFIENNGLKPQGVLITHAHFDHVGLVDEVRERYGIQSYASPKEAMEAAKPTPLFEPDFYKMVKMDAKIDVELEDGQVIKFGSIQVKSIEVPGHSIQSLCYYLEGKEALISGDTLFYHDMGRTDFYNGPDTDLLDNIRKKLFVLPEDTKVYPGHGQPTNIGQEKAYIERYYS